MVVGGPFIPPPLHDLISFHCTVYSELYSCTLKPKAFHHICSAVLEQSNSLCETGFFFLLFFFKGCCEMWLFNLHVLKNRLYNRCWLLSFVGKKDQMMWESFLENNGGRIIKDKRGNENKRCFCLRVCYSLYISFPSAPFFFFFFQTGRKSRSAVLTSWGWSTRAAFCTAT